MAPLAQYFRRDDLPGYDIGDRVQYVPNEWAARYHGVLDDRYTHLEGGREYEVIHIEVLSSFSLVWIDEYPLPFNGRCFSPAVAPKAKRRRR